MTIKNLLLISMLCCASQPPARADEPGLPPAAPEQSAAAVHRQINPEDPVEPYYPRLSDLSFAIATVPDPLVPRHRRDYDQSIAAIAQGMLDSGYVLDRYAFPWQGKLESDAGDGVAHFADDGRYGLMLFRHDAWRDRDTTQPDRITEVRALYLVPETSTYGVATQSLACALGRIKTQLANEQSFPRFESRDARTCLQGETPTPVTGRLARHPDCENSDVLLFGPAFSGSLDSLLQTVSKTAAIQSPGAGRLCVLSSSTTAASNGRINKSALDGILHYRPLAISDAVKLDSLSRLARSWQVEFEDVAFLTEASVFGSEVCPRKPAAASKAPDVCDRAVQISFPANIADVRHGQSERSAKLLDKAPLQLPALQRHLSLEEGAENGSEFPQSLQSRLTSVSAELELDDAITRLRERGARIVVIAATDVRDRLFLVDLLRARLPQALLVDFETDTLLAHPDFVHASRGALALGSSELLCDESGPSGRCSGAEQRLLAGGRQSLAAWSTDTQAILSKAVANVDVSTADSPSKAEASRTVFHVVGLDGLKSLALSEASNQGASPALASAHRLGFLGILLLLMMLALNGSPNLPGRADRRQPIKNLKRWETAFALGGVALLFGPVASTTADGIYLLIYTLFFLWTLLLAGHYRREALAQLFELKTKIPPAPWIGFAVIAIVLIMALPLLDWCSAQDQATPPVLDRLALLRLSTALHSGLAFQLALILAVTALLHYAAVLLSSAAVMARNRVIVERALRLSANEAASTTQARFNSYLSPAKFGHPVLWIGGGALALITLQGFRSGLRLTVFGPPASALMLVALGLTSFVALLLLVKCLHLARRIVDLCGFTLLRNRKPAAASGGQASDKSKDDAGLGLWRGGERVPLDFVATPIAALVSSGGESAVALLGANGGEFWSRGLRKFWESQVDDDESRIALFALLASEIAQFRRAGFGAALCALVGIGQLYLFPITGADTFMLFNLGLIVTIGLLSGYFAVRFERDRVLSNILCNRSEEAKFSTSLFAYIAFPFVVLSVAIAIAEVPGVLDWGGGLLNLLLSKVGYSGGH